MPLVPGFAQEFIDSDIGLVIGTAFHTLAAITLLGGLVGYVAWHRHLRLGHHHERLLSGAATMTYLSILVNLIGGFMRTWAEGHPPITEFATSAWVRAITLKHLFLFVGMGAAVYLFEVVARRHLSAFRAGTLQKERMNGHSVGVFLVALGILMAGVLGAASKVLPLEDTETPPAEDEHDEHDMNGTEVVTVYENASGQLTSTPLDPDTQTGNFEVPEGARSIEALLTWAPAEFDMTLGFNDPQGSGTEVGGTAGSLTRDLEDPLPGTWGFVVGSDLALDLEWDLTIRVSYAPSNQTTLADSVTIPPQGGYEINTQMPLNGTLYWDWTSTGTVHFNIHSHFDDEVQDHVDEDGAASDGSYTNERAGGYSYYWTNDGALPVTLDYRVWGDFTLDSIT